MRLNFSKWSLVYRNVLKSANGHTHGAHLIFIDGRCIAANPLPHLKASIPLEAPSCSSPMLTNIILHQFAVAIDVIKLCYGYTILDFYSIYYLYVTIITYTNTVNHYLCTTLPYTTIEYIYLNTSYYYYYLISLQSLGPLIRSIE